MEPEEAPPKNKGGFFSGAGGFVSGKEAIKEVELLVSNAKERMYGIFSQFIFRACTSPAFVKRVKPEPNPELDLE